MTSKPENPPAFPHSCNQDYAANQQISLGMTLRDYFAAAALQGFIAQGAVDEMNFEEIALICGGMADAMLKERNES